MAMAELAEQLDPGMPAWASELPGVAVDWQQQVDSTSAELRRRFEAGLLTWPQLLWTDWQTAGRGTRGRSWVQPGGSAGLDLALTLAAPLAAQWQAEVRLSLLLGAKVALAVEAVTGLPTGVKWPNDLLLAPGLGDEWRKAGGLLLETLVARDGQRWLLCGVGINVNTRAADFPFDLAPQPTTVSEAAGRPVDRTALHAAVARELASLLLEPSAHDIAALLAAWRARDKTGAARYTLVRAEQRIAVEAVGVDSDSGALIVRLPGGATELVQSYTELEAG